MFPFEHWNAYINTDSPNLVWNLKETSTLGKENDHQMI